MGKTQFAAVNLIMPFLMILGTLGFMFGTGGSALMSVKMGAEKKKEANEIFSLLIYTSLILGVIIAALGIFFIHSVAVFLGADGKNA